MVYSKNNSQRDAERERVGRLEICKGNVGFKYERTKV